jgi:NDP-sugar pyrophosphorylase family protein
MHTMTDLRVYLLDDFAVRIEHWFDLLTASGLYCREFGANILRPAAAILPASLVTRLSEWSWLMERVNTVGKNCRIHRSAVLEGCVLGDGVEIGPFAYLRGAVIGDGALIGAHSSVRMSYVGDGAYIMGSDVLNSYVGSETSIVSPMLYNVVFGERGFLSGGSGFADFIVGAASIVATIDGREVPTNQTFLGSAVGDDCFLGVNLVFAPGRTIPGGTRLLDNGLVKHVPAEGGTYVLSGTTLLRVPDGFVGKGRA